MNGAMRIYGLDFTSAPSSGSSKARNLKRLMLAVCTLENGLLKVDNFERLNGTSRGDYSKLEAWLRTEGEWIAGLDFPFGQPAQLIDELDWPKTWTGYVGRVCELGKNGFEKVMEQYKAMNPRGQKELRRETDCKAGAISPMKLYGVPVGKREPPACVGQTFLSIRYVLLLPRIVMSLKRIRNWLHDVVLAVIVIRATTPE